ncbi:hypothetical protein LPJ53_001106 [Coemansia erecta]|uniref:Uncharacterized protein n=1 Tax=Coemansia erecta TaxID=147472 RepID=A0A9W8CUY5_9FUNG|nr:hypothetical protein LPJ53_001106 [Coemansia erecta]
MDATGNRLTPTSMPTSLEYVIDGPPGSYIDMTRSPHKNAHYQYPQTPLQQQPPPQVIPNSGSRPNGLLGKMFRKSTTKHPKLNPVGISSKDFFGDGPRSAITPASTSELGASPKGVRLTRKLSALPATESQLASQSLAATMQSIVPRSATALTFGLGANGNADSRHGETTSRFSGSFRDAAPFTPPPTGEGFGDAKQYGQRQRFDRSLPHMSGGNGNNTSTDAQVPAAFNDQSQRIRPSRLNLTPMDISEPPARHTETHPSVPGSVSPAVSDLSSISPKSQFAAQTRKLNDSDDDPLRAPIVSHSDLMNMYDEAERGLTAGERKKGGSMWRAKLSFTNVRRPETRSQRHQSFDSNSVDIATHSRVYSESPLVSVPSAAPSSARGNSPGTGTIPAPFSLDALLGAASESMSLRSAPPRENMEYGGVDGSRDASSEDIARVGSLGNIDKDFLLTIQRNSALEARRQRRRETRRNTMSFLGMSKRDDSADAENLSAMPSTPPAGSAARKNNSAFIASTDTSSGAVMPHGITREHLSRLAQIEDPPATYASVESVGNACPENLDVSSEHTEIPPKQLETPSVNRRKHELPEICYSRPSLDAFSRPDASARQSSDEDIDMIDGPVHSNKHATAPSSTLPKKPRPLSSDSLTYAEQPAAGSNPRLGSSSGEEDTPTVTQGPPSSGASTQKTLLSELGDAVLKESIASAALSSTIASDPSTANAPPKQPSPPGSSVSPRSVTTATLRSPVLVSSTSSSPDRSGDTDTVSMQFSTSATYSSPTRTTAASTTTGSVPPVPPLPRGIPSKSHKHITMVSIPSPAIPTRPGTANPHNSPRLTSNSRRYRGSTSVVPSTTTTSAGDTESVPLFLPPVPTAAASVSASNAIPANSALPPPPLRPPASQVNVALSDSGWDAESIRLQRYRMGPSLGRSNTNLTVDCTPVSSPPRFNGDHGSNPPRYAGYQPSAMNFTRKLSHPDTNIQTTSHALLSPTHSPDILSKSVSNLASVRMSVDASKRGSEGGSANSGHTHKHGISRLFSVTPSSRKSQQTKQPLVQNQALSSPNPSNASNNSSNSTLSRPQQSPASPTVTSLVGDPFARRKIRDQLASSAAFDRLLEEDDQFTMAISLTPSVAGVSRGSQKPR